MSDEKKVVVQYNGVGFFGLLTLIFIALKLTGFIDWSWWWVIAPVFAPLIILFGGLAIVGAAFIVAGIGAVILVAISKIFK